MRSMQFLLLLILAVDFVRDTPTGNRSSSSEETQGLAARIVQTELECNNLKYLETKKLEYSQIQKICEEILNQYKYQYILDNFELEHYAKLGEEFPVKTRQGEKLVRKPPEISTEEMKEKTTDLQNKMKFLEYNDCKMAQEMVDLQIKCELQTSKSDCEKNLNCLKDKFITDHKLDLKRSPIEFIIMYKGQETKISSPPDTNRDCSEYVPKEKTKDSQNSNDDEEFAALDRLDEEPLKEKESSKMVTKGIPANIATAVATDVALTAVKKGLGREQEQLSLISTVIRHAIPELLAAMIPGGGAATVFASAVGNAVVDALVSRAKEGMPDSYLVMLKNYVTGLIEKLVTSEEEKWEVEIEEG